MKATHTRMSRQLCLFLALILSVGAFASCGSSSPESVPSETQASSEIKSPEETETADYLETLPAGKYDGKTFSIIAEDTTQRPNFDIGETTGDAFNDSLFDRRITVENLYDIVIEQKSMENRSASNNEVQRSVLADESVYNLVSNPFIQGSAVLMANNILLDMKKMPAVDFSRKWWSQNVVEHFTIHNSLYLSTGTLSPSYFLSATAVLYNVDLAGQYQLDNPQELVQSGKWTIDAMSAMMQNSTHDLNGDGTIDEFNDLIGAIATSEAGRALFIGAGGSLIEKQDDTFVLDLTSAFNVDVMDKLHSIFDDNLDSAYWVDAHATDVTIGKNDVFKSNNSMFAVTTLMFVAAELRDMEMDYGVLPLPKWNESQKEYITPGNPFCPCAVCVPKTCDDTALTGLVMETLTYLGYRDIQPVVYDTILKGKVARDPVSASIMEMLYKDVCFDFNSAFDLGGTMSSLREYIVGGTENFVSTYAASKKTAQSELDKIMKQIQELNG